MAGGAERKERVVEVSIGANLVGEDPLLLAEQARPVVDQAVEGLVDVFGPSSVWFSIRCEAIGLHWQGGAGDGGGDGG